MSTPIEADALCRTYDVALLDLDGVVYIGPDPVVGAVPALRAAATSGMHLTYVTNNAARPPSVVRDHLIAFGLDVDEDDVVTSSQAAASLLVDRVPPGSPVATVGGAGVAQAMQAKGFRPVATDDDSAVALVMGYGPDVTWRDLSAAAIAVQRGAVFVATNTDRTIPTPAGIAPGNGMMVEAVVVASGRYPVVAGKPQPTLFLEAVARTGARRPLVVGDRLDTDIEGAVNADLDSLLVLTGVTSARQAVLAPPHLRPTYVAADLDALLHAPTPVRAVDQASTAWRCGDWQAELTEGGTRVEVAALAAGALAIHAVQAACAAAWSSDLQVIDVVGLP